MGAGRLHSLPDCLKQTDRSSGSHVERFALSRHRDSNPKLCGFCHFRSHTLPFTAKYPSHRSAQRKRIEGSRRIQRSQDGLSTITPEESGQIAAFVKVKLKMRSHTRAQCFG